MVSFNSSRVTCKSFSIGHYYSIFQCFMGTLEGIVIIRRVYMPYKENSAGEQQPYIPAGNGERSGEYTFKNGDGQFETEYNCSKGTLEKLLSKDELKYLAYYTDYSIGTELNTAIRQNNLSQFGVQMRDGIINAINKFKLPKELKVYRGISIKESEFYIKFNTAHEFNSEIIGSLICSTSRKLERAIYGANKNISGNIPIVFEIDLPKGYHALPVEAIAKDYQEQEVILNAPRYTISKIENWHWNDFNFKKIYVKIKE